MSPRKAVSIGLVILLHALIGYAFITGLAYNVIKKAASELKTVDIKDQPPPPDKPPPPPPPTQKVEPPPVVAPPPIVQTQVQVAPPVVTTPVPTPVPVIHETAPPATPPPPAPKISQAASAKGDPSQWFSTDDYPPAALRENREGVVKIAYQINEQGKVDNCNVTASSGSPDLDETSCKLILRRGKFTPAKDQNGNPIRSSGSRSVRWQIPKE